MRTVKCQTIANIIEELAPKRLAESWDNVGLLIGDGSAKVDKILVCLDATEWVIDEAIHEGADMLVCHHPIIFGSLKRITADTVLGKKLLRLISNGISVYCSHTNYDVVGSGLNDLFSKHLGFKSVRLIEAANEDGTAGLGRIGELEQETILSVYANNIKAALGIDKIKIAGDPNKIIKKVAMLNGSGNSFASAARFAGADVLVTGDMQYHEMVDAVEAGLCIIDAGHFATERIMIPAMADYLRNKCLANKYKVLIIESKSNEDISVIL